MTDPLGQSQVLPYLVGLAAKGHVITLLSCEKTARYAVSAEKIKAIVVNAGIKWVTVKYTSKPKVISTLFDVFKLKRNAFKLHRNYKFDIVHCRSYISALAGLALKRRCGVRFVFDMRGLWADERIDGKIWNIKNPVFKIIYRYFKKKEKEFLIESDYTISLTSKGKNEILSWDELKNKKVNFEVIPCCCDTELFNPSHVSAENKAKARKDVGVRDDSLVVAYLGSVGTWYLPEEMFRFFKKLILKRPDSIFLFITPDNPNEIIEMALRLGIPEDKLIIREASRQMVPVLLGAADISLFFIKPAYSKKASSPTKQAEIMSLGQPIICNSDIGDTDEIINEAGAGIVINDFTDDEFDRAIGKLDDILSIPPENIRQAAINRFDLSIGVELYNGVYKKILE